ncbi:MAG: hypothetical protein UW55_C0033G0001 [Candidatus Giovannonibacteria bacterium GW2011_GWA2_44_26]|uniref:Nudix hydrolase domain-containing protein n=1 Tax=Candidatus Giovannonibacteria bacterium GW2011_GWA2_44_26 TaxID=1618648 RepID=A0A0G1IQ99_9BACT|nr:MAG: hypothetical protein UW55_C0033G0001 [Candidatus Giovannonibacteria bacterium GW2011_GWA2_44_26]
MTKYLKIIQSSDVFPKSKLEKPSKYTERETVKAIVKNNKNEIALVTNSVHNLYSLPGGGAESDDLETEIIRECLEEINQEVKIIGTVGVIQEFRDRDAKEYINTCFEALALGEVVGDTRTEDEIKNGLRVEWVSKDRLKEIFAEQSKRVKNGEIGFYNTAFNILRDQEFIKEYFNRHKYFLDLQSG